MLTGKQVRVRYSRDRIIPCTLDANDPEWLETAERLREIFQAQQGQTRGELEEDVYQTFGSDPSQLVHQGLAKLLEDRCEFEIVSGLPPEQLREAVFAAATASRRRRAPLKTDVGAPETFHRDAVLREVGTRLELSPEAVDQGLFADLKSEQRLVRFQDITPQRLLQRYNVALAQSVLLRSTHVEIQIHDETPQRFRQLFRAIKFHRLVCEVKPLSANAFRLQLDGPLSLFSATQKYGLQLALFLPSLLRCREFVLEARLLWGPQRREKRFTLSSSDGLVSHTTDTGSYVPAELKMFSDLFRQKIADWELVEEAEIFVLGDRFWVPDFRLVHQPTGKIVFLEVLGFWRRSSAEKHLELLRKHLTEPFILAVSDQLHIDDADLKGLPAGIHRFRQMPLPDEVARLAEKLL
ncbi:MAG TPA: DUF790 family protein [Gemmataceae bacterium]|nr:DUF790 family protein [Gemmataceae bacterium]